MNEQPYSHGWPLWPFTRLSPKAMAKLLKTIEGKRLDETEEALL
jgi:hypothetical protein